MNVWSISASISVTINIWTKFGRAQASHYYDDGMCQIHLSWKSKMAAAAILNFWKMSITPYWIKMSAPNLVGWCIMAMQRWPRDENRNRKLIRVTSSNESLEHKRVDLSNYKRFGENLVRSPSTTLLTRRKYKLAATAIDKIPTTSVWIQIFFTKFGE